MVQHSLHVCVCLFWRVKVPSDPELTRRKILEYACHQILVNECRKILVVAVLNLVHPFDSAWTYLPHTAPACWLVRLTRDKDYDLSIIPGMTVHRVLNLLVFMTDLERVRGRGPSLFDPERNLRRCESSLVYRCMYIYIYMPDIVLYIYLYMYT
jgi:hypothetical protein